LLKYKTVLGKLAVRIGTLRGPDLARGLDVGDRWITQLQKLWTLL